MGTSEQVQVLHSPEDQTADSYSEPPVLRHLYKVINSSHHNDPSCSLIDLKSNVYIVASFYPFGLRTLIFLQNTNKFLICIIFIINCFYFFICNFFRKLFAYSVARIPRFIGTKCGVKFNTTFSPAAYPSCSSISGVWRCSYSICFDIFIHFTVKIRKLCSSSCS